MGEKLRTVDEFMTATPHAIEPKETITTALRRMRQLGVRHLPVKDGPHVIGVLSERELEILGALPSLQPETTSVAMAMITEPYHVEVGTPLHDVARNMLKQKVGSALVMRGEALVGIFTTIDALRALASLTE